MRKSILIIVCLIAGGVFAQDKFIAQKPKQDQFYVFKDANSKENHGVWSGFMGDWDSLKLIPNSPNGEKNTCIKVTYSSEQKQGAGWAGIYWQIPANNWANKRGGYDLSDFKKLKFKVKGNGYVEKFFVGGIADAEEQGDSGEEYTDAINLNENWVEVEIDLKEMDLSHIIGPFGFVFVSDFNPKGATMYLDDIVFVRK